MTTGQHGITARHGIPYKEGGHGMTGYDSIADHMATMSIPYLMSTPIPINLSPYRS